MASGARILREPVLHFLLLGALAFAASPDRRPEVRVSADELAAREDAFRAEAGRAPGPREREALLERAIDEQILLAEAFRLGLDRHDSAVATRLARIGSFVSDGAAANGADAVARARALGLHGDDVVIRRYLVERMRLRLARGGDAAPPSRAALEAHVRAHPERFALPERITLRHVFLRDEGEDAAARRRSLERALATLPVEQAARQGDPSPRNRRMNGSREAIARAFGAEFLAALDTTRTQRWQGPIRSAHGLHWVFIESVTGREPAAFEAVRARAAQEVLAERRAARLSRRLAELREHYVVALP